jgi:CPA2 family monovalent cation:H+ antiporter-2/glutathione-regulated potassium-efflux system protein KefB
VSVGLLTASENAVLTAVIIISMALTPLMVVLHDRFAPKPAVSMDGVEAVGELHGSVLIIGFGRVGQIVSQPLLARGVELSIIETDAQRIRDAADFGFKVYYGDGCRLDILHAAGAADAQAVMVCVDEAQTATRIVKLIKAEFPLVPVIARSIDREHAATLVHAGVDFQMRETFESSLILGARALDVLGVPPEEAAEVMDDLRRRDAARFELELVGGLYAGRTMIVGNAEKPAGDAPAGV